MGRSGRREKNAGRRYNQVGRWRPEEHCGGGGTNVQGAGVGETTGATTVGGEVGGGGANFKRAGVGETTGATTAGRKVGGTGRDIAGGVATTGGLAEGAGARPPLAKRSKQVYMMPEGSENGDLRLYKAVEFPL